MTNQDKKHQNIDVIREKDLEISIRKKAEDLNIYAVIPLRSHVNQTIDQNEVLLKRCVKAIQESSHINKVVITTDDENFMSIADRFQNSIAILRPATLSKPNVRLNKVLQFTVNELESRGEKPDILVPAEITYPFRPQGIFDNVIEMLLSGDYDTVIAGMAEFRVCWKKKKSGYQSIMDTEKPRSKRAPLHVGLPSLATAIYSDVVKKGKRYGEKIGIYEVNDPFASIEIRTPEELDKVAKIFYWPAS